MIVDGNSANFDKNFGRKNKKFRKHKVKKDKKYRDNSNENTATLLFTQIEFSSWYSGKKGYKSSEYYLRDEFPKDKWAINKSKS